MMDLDGPRQSPSNGKKVNGLVILLHGYGADGNDLIGLAPIIARDLPEVEFVSPHAPFPCEMSPYGRQWFSLGDRSKESMLAGVTMAAQVLNGFIDEELEKNNLSPNRLALVGFSQGTMLSLFVGPRRETTIAGIVGYSGRLIAPELLVQDTKTKPPVTLIHGASDDMVPSSSLEDAVNGLNAVGIETSSELRPGLGHSIDEEGLNIGCAFLKRVLAS
ncbi:dienelactone hydrolase family protein [Rhodospirillaceae bacterium]|nr:dienelactone hydrolase family protein [Rhodospirillaceae bacterium]